MLIHHGKCCGRDGPCVMEPIKGKLMLPEGLTETSPSGEILYTVVLSRRSLAGYCPWDWEESDRTEAT